MVTVTIEKIGDPFIEVHHLNPAHHLLWTDFQKVFPDIRREVPCKGSEQNTVVRPSKNLLSKPLGAMYCRDGFSCASPTKHPDGTIPITLDQSPVGWM